MKHIYSDTFFDYIDQGSRSSARSVVSIIKPIVEPQSVADFGSGRGAWLAEWVDAGVTDVLGLDGPYVDQDQLAIPKPCFEVADLTDDLDLGRKFDLAQSLEVGEHLPPESAETLVGTLCRHADIVLFSAAVKGQGGENHINEQPLSHWQRLFAARGFEAFDAIRPQISFAKDIEPWYRYNSVLYANAEGQVRLPSEVLGTKVAGALSDAGNLKWRMRKLLVRLMPRPLVTTIAKTRASMIAARSGA